MIKTKIQFLPNLFCGFYESSLSTIIDSHEENEMEDISEQLLEQYNIEAEPCELWDTLDIDYVGAHKCLSEIYIDNFLYNTKGLIDYNKVCNFDSIKFSDLIYPKYYNFETDKLEVSVELNPVNLLTYAEDNLTSFTEYLSDNFKSRDGFSSFYSHEPRDWFNGSVEAKSEYIYYSFMFDFFIFNSIDKLGKVENKMYCRDDDHLDYIEKLVMESVWRDSSGAIFRFVSYDLDSIAKDILEKRNETD